MKGIISLWNRFGVQFQTHPIAERVIDENMHCCCNVSDNELMVTVTLMMLFDNVSLLVLACECDVIF